MKSSGIITLRGHGNDQRATNEELEAARRNSQRPVPPKEAAGVFGKSVFSGGSSLFDPVAAGPVDASYRSALVINCSS